MAGYNPEGLWDTLIDEQKNITKRKIDGKIIRKDGMIKHFRNKIGTRKRVKKCLTNVKEPRILLFSSSKDSPERTIKDGDPGPGQAKPGTERGPGKPDWAKPVFGPEPQKS